MRSDRKSKTRLAEAYVSGAMGEEERAKFEKLLASDSALRNEVFALRRVIERLKSDPDLPPERDLTADVLEKVGRKPAAHPASRYLKAACVLIAGSALAFFAVWRLFDYRSALPSSFRAPEATTSQRKALDRALGWLVRTQETDGSWDPLRWRGQGRSRIGLTGMAILAFVRSEPSRMPPDREAAVERALRYILNRQKKNGAFDEANRGVITCGHGIAACAVAEAYGTGKWPFLRHPIEKALAYIKVRQLPSGGWGDMRRPPEANVGITTWQLSALAAALKYGIETDSYAFERGTRYLLAVTEEIDPVRPVLPGGLERVSLPGAWKQNWYAWLFLSQTARLAHRGDIEEYVGRIRKHVIETQSSEGSWAPRDPLSSVGGRLYSTVMGALLLASSVEEG